LPITSPNLNRFSEFFSLPELAVNLQQKRVYISHHALSMSLHYLKYECQKTIDNLKKCIEINDKSQGSCDVLLYYNVLSLSLLVKEFIKLVKTWQSYGQNG